MGRDFFFPVTIFQTEHKIGNQNLMRLTFFVLFSLATYAGIAQTIICYPQPKIDLNIILSDQDEGTPISGAKIIVVGSDGTTRIGYTDSNGRLDYLSTDSLAIKPGNTYTIEVEGALKRYLGTSDAFSTEKVVMNTRIVRDLKVLQSVCRLRPLGVIFPEGSELFLDEFAMYEIEYVVDLFLSYPKMKLMIEGIFENENEIELAWRRVYIVQEKMLEMGVNYDHLSICVSQRKYAPDYDNFPKSYEYEKWVDVTFRILSLD